jgi:uncharacterized damage-inducible protein DinB
MVTKEEWEKLGAKASWKYGEWTTDELFNKLVEIGEEKKDEDIKLITAEIRGRFNSMIRKLKEAV